MRTVAVLPVMFFHAGFQGFSGGFVGVDVFFVISGYLITSIILSELSEEKFSIINFYEQRARRILPALTFVMLVSAVLAFVLMPPVHLKLFSQSLVAVSVFASNLYFYLTNDYFSPASEELPMLHTWSLAVEQQYYLFFPVMLSCLWFLGRRPLLGIVVLLTSLSFAISVYLEIIQEYSANFYLIFSRSWELFVGSIIAFYGSKLKFCKPGLNDALGAIGLAMIVLTMFIFDEYTAFPGFNALLPVIGTALVIVYTSHDRGAGKILAHKYMVAIGLISYSLYLWHQPIFAFLRLKTVSHPQLWTFIVSILLAFTMATLSYRYIERPFRDRKKVSRKAIFSFSFASLALFIGVGLSGHITGGFPDTRFEQNSYVQTVKSSPKTKQCHTSGTNYLKPSDACVYFEDEVQWAAFGDSHVVEVAYAKASELEKRGEGLRHLSFSGCPPALLFEVVKPKGCNAWIAEALSFLEADRDIKHVFLGFRHTAFLYGDQKSVYPDIPQHDASKHFTDYSLAKIDSDVFNAYWASYAEIIKRLSDSGKIVYQLYPIPELPDHVTKFVYPFSIFNDTDETTISDGISVAYYKKRNSSVRAELDKLTDGVNVIAVDPFTTLCDGEYCPIVSNAASLYFDDNHLSVFGASRLVRESVLGRENEIEDGIAFLGNKTAIK
nr:MULTISPECIES: acyltransferase family protein [unclassified Marinobacterium]